MSAKPNFDPSRRIVGIADMPAAIDGLLTSAQVEQCTSYSRRWIKDMIVLGRFPPPDIPGGGGAPNRWRRSTIQKWIDERTRAAKEAVSA